MNNFKRLLEARQRIPISTRERRLLDLGLLPKDDEWPPETHTNVRSNKPLNPDTAYQDPVIRAKKLKGTKSFSKQHTHPVDIEGKPIRLGDTVIIKREPRQYFGADHRTKGKFVGQKGKVIQIKNNGFVEVKIDFIVITVRGFDSLYRIGVSKK